jgi:TetR/AcrR family transcriptional regulator
MTASTVHPAQPTGDRRSRGRPTCETMVDVDVLLQNARRAFAKQGFKATSVREIARDSGVDPALLAHHFGSKDKLWVAVVEQAAAQAGPMIEATRHLRALPLTPRQRIEQAMMILIDQVFALPDIGMFFSTAATEQGARLDVLVERLVRPYRDVLVPLLVEAIDSGGLTRNDPDVMFAMLTNAVSKTVSYSHVLSRFSALPKRRKDFKAAVLHTALSMLG